MFFKKKKLTELELTNRFADALTKRVPELEIETVSPLEITTSFNGSPGFKHFLDNLYTEYINEPKSLKPLLSKYLDGAVTLYLPDQPIDIDKILPVIKDSRFLDGLKEIDSDAEASHVFMRYNSDLFIFYAEDTEHTINYLTKEKLDDLGLTLEELGVKAIENLSRILEIEKHGEDGNYMLVAGGTYESSAILLDIWSSENFPVEGEITIAIPSRDLLLVTGNKNSKNLHKLYDVVEKLNRTGDHLVSNKLFELKNGKFKVI